MTSSNAGRASPQPKAQPPPLNKFKVSRRGGSARVLPACDDARMLMSLPKDVPERTWAEILQKEENDLLCLDIREEILEEALRVVYERYMDRQTALFTSYCAAEAWLKLIDWHFYRHDPGEEPTAHPLCFIPKRAESWTPDAPPYPSPKDTWGRQDLDIAEGAAPEEVQVKWPSCDSLDYPVVEDIPEQYWFPGKLKQESPRGEESEDSQLIHPVDDQRHTKKPPKKSPSAQWDYADHSYDTLDSETLSEEAPAESEVLQKVTDYSKEEFSKPSTSTLQKPPSPGDGSLRGAGDSAVDAPARARRTSLRRFDKSKSGFSRVSVRSRQLASLDGSTGSRGSVISDCRLRGLRLETHCEISSEKLNTPMPEVAKRNK